MENNKQLYEKIGNEYKEVFPLNFIENIVDKVSGKTLAEIITSYNNIYVPYKGTAEDTRNAIPVLLRRRGLWISYNVEDKSITEKYIGTTQDVTNNWGDDDNWEKIPDVSLVQVEAGKLPDGIITPSKLSPALQQLINEHKTIYNLPDDEDLEEVNGVIRLKDREYNPLLDNSKGYKILRRNWIGGKNVLTQEMINDVNTIYEIRYDFDLNGREIAIPEGCVLDFKGGSLSNGNIIGNNSSIINVSNNLIFKDIEIKGTWIIDNIYSNWFNFSEIENYDNYINFNNLMRLSKSNIVTNIYISEGIYYTTVRGEDNIATTCMKIPSNTNIFCNAEIRIIPNSFKHYSLFSIRFVKNITISGGKFIGDIKNHIIIDPSNKGEWGHGIRCDGSNNIKIEDCEFSEFWGDGIDIIALYDNYENAKDEEKPNNFIINNVKCLRNGRQGMSIEAGEYIKVLNCDFCDTSSIQNIPPGAGIDIEPWHNNHIIKNIIIDNCRFSNNKMGFNISGNDNTSHIIFSNSKLENDNCTLYHTNNISINNIISEKTSFLVITDCNDIIVENSNFYNDLIFRDNVSNIKINKCYFEDKGSNWYGGLITFTKSEKPNVNQYYNNIYITNCEFINNNHYLIFTNISGEYFNNIIMDNNKLIINKGSINIPFPICFSNNNIYYKDEILGSLLQLNNKNKTLKIINNKFIIDIISTEWIFAFNAKTNISEIDDYIISNNSFIGLKIKINISVINSITNIKGIFTNNNFDINKYINFDIIFNNTNWIYYNNISKPFIDVSKFLHLEKIIENKIISLNNYICIKIPVITNDRLIIKLRTVNRYTQIPNLTETITTILYNNDFIKINPTYINGNFYYDNGFNDIPAFIAKKDNSTLNIYINSKTPNVNNLTLFLTIDSVNTYINDKNIIITNDKTIEKTELKINADFIFGSNIKSIDNSILTSYNGMKFFDVNTKKEYIRYNNNWIDKDGNNY